MDKKIGLALGGGGVRGFMHVGLLQAMEEVGWRPSYIAGTSIGAIIGALCAAGYSAKKIEQELGSADWTSLLKPAFHKGGLLSMENLGKRLEKSLPESFESLEMPLSVVATNLQDGHIEVMSQGRLIPALLASSCLPVIFQAVEIDGKLLADGGMVCNLPARLLHPHCDLIIGSACSPAGQRQVAGMAEIMERSLNIAIYQNTLPDRALCHYLIEPEAMNRYGIFHLNQRDFIKNIGYEEAKKVFQS